VVGVRDLLHIHLLVGVGAESLFLHTSACVSIRQLRLHTSAYVSIRDPFHIHRLVGVGRELIWDERLFVMPATPPHRYSVYLLYWYKSTNTDAAGRHRVGVKPSRCS